MAKSLDGDIKIVATNRKATHDYTIEDRFEAGLALLGTEIKSIRAGQANLREGYVQPRQGELFLVNTHISTYEPAGRTSHDPLRPRKLLMHRKEIIKIMEKLNERGYTLIPLKIYLKHGLAKIEIALARGKRQYDKRQAIAERDAARQIDRTLKGRHT
jgi:SsrA-binding protein